VLSFFITHPLVARHQKKKLAGETKLVEETNPS
jgi:hypothetical protein